MPSRTFLALTLPDPSRALLRDSCAAFRATSPAWAGEKWVDPGLLHITVKFIGALPGPALALVLEALREEGARHTRLHLELSDVRAVPSERRASMLWTRMGGETERCQLLASGLEGVLEELLGLARDSRSFLPHVTLVRARSPRVASPTGLDAASAVLQDPARAGARTMSVPSVTLFASTLGPAGPTYRELGVIPLSGR